ncbi:hypothetical protein HDU67_006240 [Dinochytrium kinnereticum]|nr:hypothetical protein HDU67_006240 [Dinochytrium kinnereticum]
MRSYLVERKQPLQRRWWWSKWWRGLKAWSTSWRSGGSGGGGLGGWGTPWGGATTGLIIGGAMRLGPGAQVGTLAGITKSRGSSIGSGRIGVLGTGGTDDPRMVTAMVVVGAIWMLLGIVVSTAILMNDGIVASYFVSGRRGGRSGRLRGRQQQSRRRRAGSSRVRGVGSPGDRPPQRRPFLRWRGLGFGRRRNINHSSPSSPQSLPSRSGRGASGGSIPGSSVQSPALRPISVLQGFEPESPLAGPASPTSLGPRASPASIFTGGRRRDSLDENFDPLPGPALSQDGTFEHAFKDLLEHFEVSDHEEEDDDDDSVVLPLDIPGGGAEEGEDDEDDGEDDMNRESDGFDDSDAMSDDAGDDIDFAAHLSPRLAPTLILESEDEDNAEHLGSSSAHLLDEDALLIREEDHLFLDTASLRSRASSPARSPASPLRRRMRFRLRRSAVPGTLAAVGAFLLLGVLWLLRRRGWALLPKLWQLAGRRWGGEL